MNSFECWRQIINWNFQLIIELLFEPSKLTNINTTCIYTKCIAPFSIFIRSQILFFQSKYLPSLPSIPLFCLLMTFLFFRLFFPKLFLTCSWSTSPPKCRANRAFALCLCRSILLIHESELGGRVMVLVMTGVHQRSATAQCNYAMGRHLLGANLWRECENSAKFCRVKNLLFIEEG